jgi:transposase-like protein
VNSRATYTEAEKAAAYVVLTTNDGNVKRTARDLGYPENTVRRWKKDWEQNGPPSTDELEVAVGAFLERATSVRDDALTVIDMKLQLLKKDPDKAKLAELTTVLGVLDDKITRASGLATSRTEHTLALPSGDELVAPLIEAFKAVQQLTAQREGEVIEDAEYSDVERKALPSGQQA